MLGFDGFLFLALVSLDCGLYDQISVYVFSYTHFTKVNLRGVLLQIAKRSMMTAKMEIEASLSMSSVSASLAII